MRIGKDDTMAFVIENNRDELIELCRKHKVTELDVFGSAATEDFDDDGSDIDFLVEFEQSAAPNRFDNFFNLLEGLKQLFNRPVDLVEPGGLRNPYFIEMVNKTKRRIYAVS